MAAHHRSLPETEGARDVAAIALAALVAGWLLYVLFHGKLTRFEDIGLGRETVAVFASFEGDPIHCGDMTSVAGCLAGFERRGSDSAALWLGNSQLHGVNQWKPGQETASARLFSRLRERGLDLVTLSQPNANLQEHLVLYSYVRTRLPLRQLVLPAVFDDMRETGVRASIAPALDDPSTREQLQTNEIGRAILATTASVADPDLAALDATLQERTESFLNAWLEGHVELWELRPEARGRISNWLFDVRNSIFGITPRTKRRTIVGRYMRNFEAAEAILADARAQGIRVLVYLAPIRGDAELPYEEAEYVRYGQEVAALAERYGADFVDLSEAVPAELYGMTEANQLGVEAEIDFMHFQAGGHAILAERLAAVLNGPRHAGSP